MEIEQYRLEGASLIRSKFHKVLYHISELEVYLFCFHPEHLATNPFHQADFEKKFNFNNDSFVQLTANNQLKEIKSLCGIVEQIDAQLQPQSHSSPKSTKSKIISPPKVKRLDNFKAMR